MMDIKRSDRLRKTAAIAALVLAINSTGATAELGTTGFWSGNIVNAIDSENEEIVFHYINNASDLDSFVKATYNDGKTHVAQFTEKAEEVEVKGGYDTLSAGKVIYGDGSTIIITGNQALFKTVANGARIENISIKANTIETTETVGVVCNTNNGEIRYVDVEANISSKVKGNASEKPCGMVCGVNNGTIFGCKLDGNIYTENYRTGSICGTNSKDGLIERCSSAVNFTFSRSARYIGGLCGYNAGKIYDCIFEGTFPHTEWSEDYINAYKSTSIADEYRNGYKVPGGRTEKCYIAAFSGYLDTRTGYIKNSVYNGRIELTKNEYDTFLSKPLLKKNKDGSPVTINKQYVYEQETDENGNPVKDENGKPVYKKALIPFAENIDYIEDDKEAPKDLYCNGNYNIGDRMANTYRIDTYTCTYTDETTNQEVTKTIVCHAHYHTEYGDQGLSDTPLKEYAGDNLVRKKLNYGTDDSRPTEEFREDVWEPGEVFPRLCLDSKKLECAIEHNDLIYNGETQELIKPIKVDKGYVKANENGKKKIWYSLDGKEWSLDVPTRKLAGKYKVYYKVEAGKGYKCIPEDLNNQNEENIEYPYVEVTIKPRKLKIKDETISYTGNIDITDKVTVDTSVKLDAEGNDLGFGLAGNDTWGKDVDIEAGTIKILKGKTEVSVDAKGEYTISAKSNNTNYEIVDGTLTVTDPDHNASLKAPTADPITYGQSFTEAELSSLIDSDKPYVKSEKWEWVVKKDDVLNPAASKKDENGNVIPYVYTARIKVDPNYDYTHLNDDCKDDPIFEVVTDPTTNDTYVYAKVDVVVNKKKIGVAWKNGDVEEVFEYDPEVTHLPEITITETDYVGKDGEDKTLRPYVKPNKQGNAAGSYSASVVFPNDTTETDNYYVDSINKSYRVTPTELNLIKDVELSVVYGEDSKPENIQGIIEGILRDRLKDQEHTYDSFSFDGKFEIKGKDNNKPLDVSTEPYVVTINYSYSTNTGEMDNSYIGSFKEIVTVTPAETSASVTGKTVKYNGEPQKLIDKVSLQNIDIISFQVVDNKGAVVPQSDGTEFKDVTATDADKYTVSYTFKVDGNRKMPSGNYQDNGNGIYIGFVEAKIEPKPIDARWNTDKHEFEWGTPVDISAYLEDDDVYERDLVNGKAPKLTTTNGVNSAVNDYTATAKFADTVKNYTLKNTEYKYSIIKSKNLPAIPTPSAGPITYGQRFSDSDLTENWNLAETVTTEKPNADTYWIDVTYRVDDQNYDYTGFENYVPSSIPDVNGYITDQVQIKVNPKELKVEWEDKDEFEYNGEVQTPKIIKVTGYIDEFEIAEAEELQLQNIQPEAELAEEVNPYSERAKYPVKPVPDTANGFDGIVAGPQRAIPVIDATKDEEGKDRPVNYFIDPKGKTYYKDYEIKQAILEEFDEITVKLEYNDATVENARKALLEKLQGLENYSDYIFTGEFTAAANAEGKLNVGEYSTEITYTYSGENGDNFTGKLVEKVIVDPSAASVNVTPNNRTYDGTSQPLVKVDKTVGAEIIGYTVVTVADGEEVSNNYVKVPNAIDAGNYTVYYTFETDGNHKVPENSGFTYNENAGTYTGVVNTEIKVKQIAVTWESNALTSEDKEIPEFVYTGDPDDIKVKPRLEDNDLCDRDKDKELTYSTSPEGNDVGHYTVTAELNDPNYELTNNTYDYNIVAAEAEIKIDKVLKATYGDPLSSVDLPEIKEGTLEWVNPDKPVGNVGDQTHTVKFTPSEDNSKNYKETELSVTVKVYPKDVHLIWNIDNGHKFTFNREEQKVTVRPDLKDVYDYDEKAFVATRVADDLVNAGDHKADASINNNNYRIVEGTESRTFTILPSDELQPLNYSETYEYGTTAKEIFDDLVEKHFGDFSAFAKQSSVDAKTVEVYKNGKQIDPTKIKKYIEAYSNAQNGLIDMEVVDQLNQLGARIYNKPDFNIMKCYDDYSQIKNLALSNSGRIISFINAGVLPEDSKYQKLVKLFEKYESIRDAENIMQDVGDYKIVVKYNRVADVNDQSIAKFLNLSGNYRPADLTAEIKITPCVIENLYADIESRYYNGDTNVDVNGFTFISKKNGKDKEWTLGGYDASGTAFVSPNAGTKTINTEMTLRNENFCFGYDKAGKPVMTKKFSDVATDGEILKAEWKYTVNLEGFAGDRLSSLVVPGIVHGEFKWNDTNTVIAEGPNVIDASEYTFTPKSDDPFNKNYDVVLTVNVNGVKKPVETIVETQTVVETQIVTAVETVIVTDETKPAETTVNSGDVTSGDSKVTEPAVTDVTADETKASDSVSEKAVTTASTETSGAVTTASTESTKQSVTEATTDGSAKTTDLPEITLPASTTDKLMGEVTDAKVIVTKPAETEATKAETTAKTEDDKKAVTTAKSEDDKKAVTTAKSEDDKKAVTTAKSEDDKKAVTTAKTEDDKKAVTTAVTEETKAAETTVSTATVTLPDTKAVTTSATESTKPSDTTAKTDDSKKAVTTAATEETKAAETTVSTATVTLPDTNAVTTAAAESTKPSDTTAKTDDNKKAVTTAGDVTTAETTVSTAGATTPVSESAKPAETEATKAATTAKVEDTTTAEATAETTVTTVSDTKAEETTAATTAATEETKTAEPSVTTADVTTEVTTAEVTEAATLPTLPEITMPVVTTDKLMGDVTEAVVTEAVTTSEVTTPAVTEKADLEKIREIVINEPERVTKEVREDEKISLDGEEIKLALEDKMFFQGTESFDYPVRLKDFNAEKAYFDYAGFGFELPEGFSIDPDSLTTDLKGNIKYYAPDSIEALALAAKTNYTANGGYVVFRGVETRNLDPDATLFTVKVKVADTLNVCVSRIGVSALYGRLTENSKFVEDNKVEPHIALLDNGAGEQLYTKADSGVRMGVKGDVNLDGRVSQVDATIVLREILSLEVFKKSLLAENIDHHDGTADEAVALSHFLGNVNQSPNGLFTQIDATSILRGILERDINNTGIVTEEIWKKVTNK